MAGLNITEPPAATADRFDRFRQIGSVAASAGGRMQPEVQCPDCGAWYAVKADLSGSFLKCSKCGRQFRVPYKFRHFRTEENDRTAAPTDSAGDPPKPVGGEASKAVPIGSHRNRATIPLPELVSDVWLPLVLAVVGYSIAVYVLLPFALGGPSPKAGGFLFTVLAMAYCIIVIPLVHRAFEAASRTLELALPDAAWLQSTAICSLPLAAISIGLRLSQDQLSGAAVGLAAGVVLMIPAALAMHQTTLARSVQAVAIAAIGLAASIAISLGVAIGLAYLVLPMWNVGMPWDVAPSAPSARVVPETGAPLPAVAQSVAEETKRRPATAPPSPNGNATIAMPGSPKEKLAAPSGSTIVPLPQPAGVPGVAVAQSATSQPVASTPMPSTDVHDRPNQTAVSAEQAAANTVPSGDVRDGQQPLLATLIRARYGAGEAMRDVTPRVAMLLRSNSMIWAYSGTLQMSDPVPGVVKKLAVDISIAGQTLTLSAYDGGALGIWVSASPATQRRVGTPVRPGVEVVSARYGADIRCVDVTPSISRLLSTDGLVVASSGGLGVRDPAVGIPKILTITLATESEIIVVRVTGDEGRIAFTEPDKDIQARGSRDQRSSLLSLLTSPGNGAPTRTFLAEMNPIWISTYTDPAWSFGTRGKLGNREGTPIRVAGVPSPNGLGTHARSAGNSWVSYSLGRRFRRFDGRVAINDTSSGSLSWVTFVVAGDGTELWRSKPTRLAGRSEGFSLDVGNVDELDLVVVCPGVNSHAHAVWVEPVVYTVDGAPLSVGTTGADAMAVSANDGDGRTPLALAAGHNPNPEEIAALMKATPLMLAAGSNHNPEAITALVKASADVNAKDIDGRTPLMYAAIGNSNPEVIAALVKVGGDVNAKGKSGKTPLIWAALINPNPEVIAALVKAGADVNAKDFNGESVLDYGKKNKNTKVLTELIKSGAKPAELPTGNTKLDGKESGKSEAVTLESPPAPAAADIGAEIAAESLDTLKIGNRPQGNNWSFSFEGGTVSVQHSPQESTRCLRLLPNTTGAPVWAMRKFPSQSEQVGFECRLRVGQVADGYALAILGGDKPAVLLLTRGGELGCEVANGAWHTLQRYEPNVWYTIRISADVRDKMFSVYVDGVQRGEKLTFSNPVQSVDAWQAETPSKTAGALYLNAMKVTER